VCFQTGAVARREAALEAWYRDLFDNAHDIILGLDFGGRLLSLNRAGEAALGIPRDRARDMSLTALVRPDEQGAFLEALGRIRDGAAGAHCEVELAPAPDRRVVLRMNLRRQELAVGGAHAQGVAWDVTDRRIAEEALRDSEQRLRRSLEERVRIGRDLHDGIIQSIYAVGLSLRECQRLLREDPTAAAARLQGSVADLNGVIREVRGFIEGLEPEALKGSELRTALETMAQGLAAVASVRFTIEVDPDAANRLAPRQVGQLLQIAREALTNTVRHSGAQTAQLQLAGTPDAVTLEVRDDGRGFEPATVQAGCLGLRNLQARARDLGGRTVIDAAPRRGTIVRVTLPNQPPAPIPP
jgi:PAS domain S-box-containing protein